MLPARSFIRTASLAFPHLSARQLCSTAVALDKSKVLKVPSLADIDPENKGEFSNKQKAFRERLASEKKAKEASAFSSHSSTANADAPGGGVHGLGSLSTAKGSAAEDVGKTSGRKSGPIANLIYGTKEGRELDAQIEASFSQILARGKYVHSIQFHCVKPDRVEEYVELVGKWYPRIAKTAENKVHLVGSWRTEVGDCDTFVHIWEYRRYQGYHSSLNTLSLDPEYPAFDRQLRSLISARHESLMQEFSFWPTSPPRQLGGIFELRSYKLHPGNLLEWETHWRRGLLARREVMEGVGAWFVQLGELNTVHHLWQFANLEERKVQREMSWKIKGWADTVHKTVPLIQDMKSRILIPMPWSPVS